MQRLPPSLIMCIAITLLGSGRALLKARSRASRCTWPRLQALYYFMFVFRPFVFLFSTSKTLLRVCVFSFSFFF